MLTALDHTHESVFGRAETMRPRTRRGRPAKRKPANGMFALETHSNGGARLVVVGKASRRRASTFVNIPVSTELRQRLHERIVGSMAMGTGALLQWALDELERQAISVEAGQGTDPHRCHIVSHEASTADTGGVTEAMDRAYSTVPGRTKRC